MKQYHDLLDLVLADGERKSNRTGVDTIGVFGAMAKFNCKRGFPLLTTKKMAWKSIVHELLWFISGDTNVGTLIKNGVNIWNQDAYNLYVKNCKRSGIVPSTFEQYVEEMEKHPLNPMGELGYGTYGSMWREFPGPMELEVYDNSIDQLSKVIETLKTNPDDRRMIVTAWHPGLIDKVALPPCHVMFQFNTYKDVTGKRTLNLCMYQRSCDLFLGVPFNIASYALLLNLVAHCVDMYPGTFTHFYGDLHIYVNHLDAVNQQLNREPLELPTLVITGPREIDHIKFEDIHLHGYESHDSIKAELNTGMVKV